MIEKLVYDEKFTVVMKHVFGRTLICRNFDIATQLSRSEQMDCVTLEGKSVAVNLNFVPFTSKNRPFR